MNGFTLFMLAVVVIGLPVTLGIGSEMMKRWLKFLLPKTVSCLPATAGC